VYLPFRQIQNADITFIWEASSPEPCGLTRGIRGSHLQLLLPNVNGGVHQVETIVIHSSPIQMGVSTTNFNFANILSLFLKQLPFGPSAHKWGGKSPQHVLVFTHTLSLFLFWLDPKPIRLLLFYTPRPWASRNAVP